MVFRIFRERCSKLLFFVFACMFPLAGNSATGEAIREKRAEAAMRMIGHEVLTCLGDAESRVMPIEKVADQYKISFEFEFSFDPDDITSVIERVMTETGAATHYFVQVAQCETQETVHSFEVGYFYTIPCEGRTLPEDCYYLLITILDRINTNAHLQATSSDDSFTPSPLISLKAKKNVFFRSVFFLVPLFILLGFIIFLIKKKTPLDTDPDWLLIGESQFDKKNMALSFENKKIDLSHKEAELLYLLHTHANAPVEREVILQKVWGNEGDYIGRTLDVYISKLRKKIEADASVKIVNIRGFGYKLVVDARS